MRILIDSGDYRCSNMGDVAMLQVAVARLSALYPTASIEVITANPDYLTLQCPQATPIPHRGLQEWLAEHYLLGRLQHALPKSLARRLVRLMSTLRRRWPASVESLIRLKMQLQRTAGRELRSFLAALNGADWFVVCGQGGVNDEFRQHALAVLDLLELALRRGKRTAMCGQGLGPMRDAELLARAKAVLPRVELIALREERAGRALLQTLGVPERRIMATGDDAIELAYDNRARVPGPGIGVNIRAARHTDIDQTLIQTLRPVVHEAAKKYNAPLIPVPIARHPDCKDARDIQQLLAGYDDLSDGGRSLDTPLKVIKQVGRCRIVVTAAYHAAVFALAQGIPVVCLAKSPYCAEKLQGLAAQFGVGCEIVFLDAANLNEVLAAAIDRAWQLAAEVRPQLERAAVRQIELGRNAYQQLGALWAGLCGSETTAGRREAIALHVCDEKLQ